MVWHAWGDGEPLVLLHGGSGSWAHWIRNVEALAAGGRRVLVPDLPGFGDSERPPGNGDADGVVPVLAEGLPYLLGMQAVDIVGFSFGGLCAGLLAAAHPELVRQLVLVGAPGFGLREKRLTLVAWQHLDDPHARESAHRRNLATLMLHRPESVDALAVAVQAANVPHDRMRRRKLAMTDVLLRNLPAIECPVDAIYGEHDALYSGGMLAELERLLAAAPRFGRLVLIPEAGHWVQFEAPAAFHAALHQLLDERKPKAT
ncbi:alpha/beta hydrolase [Ramlibacter monticola]|uniref:Alpha/beta hydrolase n=2 Tax=Ramlibacter monticola TaxID=1926872 RepID=A0A937CUI6_9BURK|nr:alpha/beta hydrolase [Ramlibacter monticola]